MQIYLLSFIMSQKIPYSKILKNWALIILLSIFRFFTVYVAPIFPSFPSPPYTVMFQIIPYNKTHDATKTDAKLQNKSKIQWFRAVICDNYNTIFRKISFSEYSLSIHKSSSSTFIIQCHLQWRFPFSSNSILTQILSE